MRAFPIILLSLLLLTGHIFAESRKEMAMLSLQNMGAHVGIIGHHTAASAPSRADEQEELNDYEANATLPDEQAVIRTRTNRRRNRSNNSEDDNDNEQSNKLRRRVRRRYRRQNDDDDDSHNTDMG